MDIRTLKHADGELWFLIGRFFADRAIRRALGGPLSSDPNYTWWVAAAEDGTVAGFAGAERRKGVVTLHHAYVLPDHRGVGIYAALLEARIRWARAQGASEIRATCTEMSRPALLRRGFVVTGHRGQYATVSLDLSNRKSGDLREEAA